jgi:c-di-GMP-binding flagellar brake protein YcgR
MAKRKVWVMNQPEVLRTQEVVNILQAATADQAGAEMTYLSKGRWCSTKVFLAEFEDKKLYVETIAAEEQKPFNIQIDQPVGVSFKKDYNKYIFESIVTNLESGRSGRGKDRIVLTLPDRVDKFQRRSYFRVAIPEGLKVQVLFWHRGYHDECGDIPCEDYWKGRMLDISAGGMQIVVGIKQKPNFRTGQLVGLQFTPMPYEKPLLLEGQVRHIASTADEKNLCLGIQMIGLEASVEGREKLRQLCAVVERYHQINQFAQKPQTSAS